ncbi:MAG: DUF4340 domain-containing protein [Nodosilinea sp.]
MKLQRSTIVLVGVALLLGAGVLIAESQRAKAPETTESSTASAPIFEFAETNVATLTVERNGEILVFQQDDQGGWQITQPELGPAEPGAVAFLLSRLNTDSPLQTVTIEPDQIADFGLDAPAGTATVTLKDGTKHTLILGGEDFSGSGHYAVADPPEWPPSRDGAASAVLVVTQDVANAINRPLAEWKMPVDATLAPSTPTSGAAVEVPLSPSPSDAEPQPPGRDAGSTPSALPPAQPSPAP